MDQSLPQYQALWQSCLLQVKQCTSEEDFTRLFKSLEPIGFSDRGVLRLKVMSQQHAQKIEQDYITILAPIIRNFFGQSASISYAIPKANTHNSSTAGYSLPTDGNIIKNPFIIPGLKRVKFDSQLRSEYTLDNFIEGECNRLVRSAGVAISVKPGANSFNPLYINGGSGLGKTHLAQAIGNAIAQRHGDTQKILYVTASRFQAQFQYAANPRNNELADFIQFYQMIDVLIIDDIQEFAGKPGTQNIFFNIFNHLHMLGKQLIMTADRPPVELQDIEERLITRFNWGLRAEILPPDFTTRQAIIKAKSQSLKLNMSEEIVDMIAQHITTNVREIEGTITSIEANSRLLGKEITVDLVRGILREVVNITTSEVTIDKILTTVCAACQIDMETILSKKRTRTIASARQIAMYLCKSLTKESLGAIGKAIGGKNHATVLYACKTVSNLMDTDREIRNLVETIERKLQY